MAHLTVDLLGSLQIMLAGKPVTTLESAKARALLAYLVVEADRPHRRSALVGLLWPECPEATARHNLRQALFNLRQALGDRKAQSPLLLITRDQIQFNAASDCSLDVAQFNAHLGAVENHPHPGTALDADGAAHLKQAVELYRGKFLQDFFLGDSAEFEEWALVQREGLHQRALDALAQLADYSEKNGNLPAARVYTQRQLELDPWREQAHAQMMRLYALLGDRAAAMAQYETCRRILADELSVEPTAETRALYEQIAAGKWRPAPAAPARAPFFNLPAQLTPFVGRAREQADLAHMLSNPECRLLTLLGPGGIGKTRLALQVAAHGRQDWAQGVAFIPLASVRSVDAIVPAVAATLGLVAHGQVDPKVQLLDFLRAKQMLLILDNVEHLLDGARLFVEILTSAPGIKLLVTTREQLNRQEEWVYELPGLSVPVDLTEDIEQYDAVALLVQRARRVHTGWPWTAADRAAAVRLCQLLGGLPLAIELAAAWVRILTLSEIVREIESNLDFLSVTWRDLPERHRSLRAVFDHSWNRLTADEQTTLGRLSVFRGNFHRQAAEQVAHASLPILASLVGKSLIRRRMSGASGRSGSFGQYEMHELIRHYAEQRLVERGECDAPCLEHFRYFLHFAEQGEAQLIGRDQVAWLDRFEQEHDNFRAALDWSLKPEQTDPAVLEQALRLTGSLIPFWKRRDHWTEARARLTHVLARTERLGDSRFRSRALNGAVIFAAEQADAAAAAQWSEQNLALAYRLGDRLRIAAAHHSHGYWLWKQKDYAAAQTECAKGLTLFRQLDERFGIAESLHNLGHIAINQSRLSAARAHLEEALAVYREIGDVLGLCSVMSDLGLVAFLQGEDTMARAYLEQALSSAREIKSVATTEASLNRLGDLARARGDYEAAGKLYGESLEVYRGMGDRDEIPSLLHNLGYVEQARGNPAGALAWFREALGIHCETGNQAGIAECVEGIAVVWAATGNPEHAARWSGAAQALREQVGATLWPANRVEHDRHMARLRSMLDEPTLSAAWAEGRAMASAPFSLDSLFQSSTGIS